jgi:hypothetical protein
MDMTKESLGCHGRNTFKFLPSKKGIMTVEIHILRFVSASLQDTYTSYSMPEVGLFLTSFKIGLTTSINK